LVVASAATCYGETLFGNNNFSADLIYWIDGTTPVSGANGVWVEVLYNGMPLSPFGKPDEKKWQVGGESGLEGFWNGGYLPVPGLAENATASGIQCRFWAGGADYTAAAGTIGAWVAESAVFSQPTKAWPANAAPPVPQSGPDLALPGKIVMTQVVPEPATVLLGLAGAALLLIRRRS